MAEKTLLLKHNGKEIEFLLHKTDKSKGAGHVDIFSGKTYPIIPKLKPKLILDVGANIGATSVFFAMNYPSARIYSFEPTVMNFSLLKKNTSHFQNVTVYNWGAYEYSKKERIYLDSDSGGRNSFDKRWMFSVHWIWAHQLQM